MKFIDSYAIYAVSLYTVQQLIERELRTVGNDLGRRGRGLFQGTIPTFVRRD